MRREDPLGRQRPEYKRNVAVEREGTRKPVQPKTVTVGDIRIARPSRNVIPGEVWLSVDVRHPESPAIDAIEAEVREAVAAACARDGLPHQVDRIWDSLPETPRARLRKA